MTRNRLSISKPYWKVNYSVHFAMYPYSTKFGSIQRSILWYGRMGLILIQPLYMIGLSIFLNSSAWASVGLSLRRSTKPRLRHNLLCPQRVDDCLLRGEVAYGLTGDDLFDEYMLGAGDSPLGVLNTYDWFDPSAQFYRPALCLLNREGRIPDSSAMVSIAVNKKYELSSRQYLSQRFQSGKLQIRSLLMPATLKTP